MTSIAVPHHIPRSAAIVIVPVIFLLLVRPGPLSVDTGLAYDGFGRAPIRTNVVIPPSAIVGIDASPAVVEAQAVEVDPAQFLYAVEQLSTQFETVAVRMIGQVDVDDDGTQHLVRFRIICCAADGVRVSVRLDGPVAFERGTWLSVTGRWDGIIDDPGLQISSVVEIDLPDDPYLTL